MMPKTKRSQRGQALVESVICMLLICLVLFGLLQVFYLYVAQMVFDYASFATARSSSVGFADYLVSRSSRVASIGASGELLYPQEGVASLGDPLSQCAFEKIRIPEYLQGISYLNYEYWNPGNNDLGSMIYYTDMRSLDGSLETSVTGSNYPLEMPMREAYTSSKSVDIRGTAGVMDYSSDFLQ